MNLRGALARMDPWTASEDERLRAAYTLHGIEGARAALPHRSETSLFKRARRLGLSRRRRWTAKDEADLRELWAEGRPLAVIAGKLHRGAPVTYWKAQQLGLTKDVPPGFERLSVAAARSGYSTGQLERILRWAGKRIRVVLARPGKRKTGNRYRMIDWISLEDALAAWHETEPAEAAARRLGVQGETLRRRLTRIGIAGEGRSHIRITDREAARALALPAHPRGARGRFVPTGVKRRAA